MRMILLILCFAYLSPVSAKDYGVWGKTFSIVEMDFLAYIQQKIEAMQASGEWQALQSSFKNKVKEQLIRPMPTRLPRTEIAKAWLFNPSFTAPHDVKDMHGQIIVQKGTEINPLDTVQLRSTLIFFDGDDKDQITWVSTELKQHPKTKLILASGSIKDTTSLFQQAVYFDLHGFLLSKFHIQHLPATVFQTGKRLQINEVKL